MGVRLEKIVIEEDGDVWFFAYGSLMWDPDFDYEEVQPARMHGYHRAFCVVSEVYRGTPERPGLVLGLDRGGSCVGRAFRVAGEDVPGVAAHLQRREMQEDIYACRRVPVALPAGRVLACAFVVDRGDVLYAGDLSFEETARRIATRAGARGRNSEYLENTVRHLDALGIREGKLHALLRRVRQIAG